MRILGIDYGDRRVGFAITDVLKITAQGLYTYSYDGNDKKILKELDKILEEYEIDTIVVGMPYNMDGSKGFRVEKTESFIHKLRCKYNKIKIETIDERLTTVMAGKTMNYLNTKSTDKKKIIDTLSAVYILEDYLKKVSPQD